MNLTLPAVNIDNNETDDDYDLYSDLPDKSDVSQLNSLPTSAQTSVNQSELDNNLLDEVHVYGKLLSLERQVLKLTSENQHLQSENDSFRKSIELKDRQLLVLKNNISSLYKTAKMELDRRTEEMNKLQSRYDAIIFRRINQIQENRANESFRVAESDSKKCEVSSVKPVDNTSRVKRAHEDDLSDAIDQRHRSYENHRRGELENHPPHESTKRARHDYHHRPTYRDGPSTQSNSHSRHRDSRRV